MQYTFEYPHIEILDTRHHLLGYVSQNGFVYDHAHDLLGYVTRLGLVRNLNLEQVGQVTIRQGDFPFLAGQAAYFLLTPPEKEEYLSSPSS
jgi:hypothetical protein